MANFTQDTRFLQITSPAFDDNYLLVQSMEVTEGISQLFQMDVQLVHEEKEGYTVPEVVDHTKLLGQPVSILVVEEEKKGTRSRYFNGIISEFRQGDRGIVFSGYSMRVVPSIWISTQIVQSRIFQQKSVQNIIKEVFSDFESMIVWELEYDYKPRNYCVQYRESDFNFASRLMEEEGIYYYFEHVDDRHTMIISDKPRFNRNCPGNNEVTFSFAATDGEHQSHLSSFDVEYKLRSGVVTFRDHHIQQPNKKLGVTSSTKFQIGENGNWEIYDYPGGYARKFDGIGPGGDSTQADLNNIVPDGNRMAQTAMEVIDAGHEVFIGKSDVPIFTSGHRFTVVSHPVEDFNAEYVITSIQHSLKQSPELTEAAEDAESPCKNRFTAIAHGKPGTVPFRPQRVTPKPIVYGSQTAYVVGPSGEEIYTDEYGRIKVQFHWDREGQTDGTDSCWLPVAQTWAGKGWGSMFIPRVGMEVIVHFLEGNPDNPMVSGCVYHPMNMPPYALPENKTRSGVKTDSSKGGNGYNELRFEDALDSEQIFLHGQKDWDRRIKNDVREWTGNDQHLMVIGDHLEKIDGSHHLKLGEDQKVEIGGEHHVKISSNEAIEVGGTQTVKISGDQGIQVTGSHSTEATSSLYIKGMNVVIEGMIQLSLKAGASFIDLGPSGISISGAPTVLINSGGAAGAGSPVGPCPAAAPEAPAEADDDKPGTKMRLEKQSLERKKKKSSKDKEELSWLKLAMNYEDGSPAAGIAYEVKAPDGKFKKGRLNNEGKAHVKGIKPGNCEVTFPELDQEAWKDA